MAAVATQRQIFEQVGDAVAIVDAREASYPLLAANRACRTLLARAEAALIGQPWLAAFPQSRERGLLDRFRDCAESGVPRSVAAFPHTVGDPARAPWRAGQRTAWDCHLTPLRDDAGRVTRLLVVMTAAARQEGAATAPSPAAPHPAEAERDAFLSLIAHEIKSPLTSIKGFAQLAQREAAGAHARLANHLRVIEQQADRIVGLVGNISDAARLHDGRMALEPVAFDFATRVRAAIEEYEATPNAHPIALDCAPGALPVRADPERIGQVVAHLLANAARYSPERPPIAVAIERRGARVVLVVRDRGIGIPPEELPRVFGRFYRASNSIGGGLGLGLFIARQIAARSGGTLDAEGAPGGGSAFRLVLPLAEATAAG